MTIENPTPEEEKAKLLEEAAKDKKKLDDFQEKLKNMAGSMGVSEEELNKEGLGTKPEEPKVEASKAPEDIAEQKAVEEARGKYANEINKYKKEVKIWDRMKHYLTPEKKHAYIKEKYPDVAVLKEAYDKARVELGNKMYADQKAELEKTLKDPELTEKLTEYKESEIKLAVHFGETIDKTNARIDKLPSKRRELLNKAMGATKQGLALGAEGLKKANETKAMKIYKKIGDFGSKFKWGHVNIKGYELTIGKLGRSAVLGAMFGYAGAARYGVKLLRGTVIAVAGGAILSNMAEKHKDRLTNLEDQKSALESSLTGLSGTELMLKQEEVNALENRIVEENTSYMKKNALIVAAMIGTNIASAKIENAFVGDGAEVTDDGKPKINNENGDGKGASDSTVNKSDTLSKQPIVAKDSSLNQQDSTTNIQKDSTTVKINPNQADSTNMNQQDSAINTNNPDSTSVNNSDTAQQTPDNTIPKPPAPATNGVPEEAVVRQNEGVTYALKHQLDANPKLATALGYDKATDKVAFLADLGKKLGYIGENGDVRVEANMGAAYVLNSDGSVTEYQNGVKIEGHNAGDTFERKDVQEKYEYYNENKVPSPKSGKSVFDGPATSIAPSGARVEGSPDEFAGQATGIGGTPLDANNPDSWVLDSRGSGGRLNQELITENKKLLSTNGAAEEMARRAGVNNIAGTQDANTINLESTEQFLNEKQNILNKTFYNIASWSNDYNHARWDHVKLINMDELARPEHEFASRGEAKSVARLITKAREAGIDYHGKTADQLVNEIVKKGLVK